MPIDLSNGPKPCWGEPRLKGEPERLIPIDTPRLKGPALRWAVAKALNKDGELDYEATSSVGWRVRIKGDVLYFQPDVDWNQIGPLMDQYYLLLHEWLYENLDGPDVCEQIHEHGAGGLKVWYLRALVGYHYGKAVAVPEVLYNDWCCRHRD